METYIYIATNSSYLTYISNTDNINMVTCSRTDNVLSLDNTIEYTPTSDYHPATKKYVDDNVVTREYIQQYIEEQILGGAW